MKNLLLSIICFTLMQNFQCIAQDFSMIPSAYKSHPEYGKLTLENHPTSLELIQYRTANSRTFIDQDKKYHTTQTGGVFHYKNEKGEWISIQETPSIHGNTFGIHQSEMPINVGLSNGKTTMALTKNGASIEHGKQVQFNYLDNKLSLLTSKESQTSTATTNGNQLEFSNFFDGISRFQTFEYWSLQTEYKIQQRLQLPTAAKFVEIVDEYTLPAQWKIQYNEGKMSPQGWQGNLVIVDEKNQVVSTISNPLLFDAYQGKTKESMKNHFSTGAYLIEQSGNQVKLHLRVDTEWLNNEALVYPVTIDPTATNTYAVVQGLEDKNTQFSMNCVATMDVTIPVGQYQVTGTTSEWRIWAKGYIYTDNYADKVEQRSRIGYNANNMVWSATQSGAGTLHNGANYNYTAANNGQTFSVNNINIANGCYTGSTVHYFWQGYQTFYPHTGNAPAASKVAGCVTNYQELVVNTWKVTTTYNVVSGVITATPATQSICSGETTGITLSSTNQGTTSYAWTVQQNGTTGASNGNGATIAQTLSAATQGTATYSITPSFGTCVGTPITVTVTVNAVPVVNAGNDVSVCQGQPVTLNGTGATSYQWDQNVVNNVAFTPNATTTYTVTGTENGCSRTDQVIVTVLPLPVVQITADKTEGCIPFSVNFTSNTLNTQQCKWTFGTTQVDTVCGSISHTFTSPGCNTITLEVETLDGCIAQQTLNDMICSSEQPIAEFIATPNSLTSMNSNSVMTNNSLNATSYYWNFGDHQVSYDVNPTHTFPGTKPGNYTITLIAINSFGCRDTAYQVVTVQDGLVYYVPNAFTPNGDESNQTFKPVFFTGYDPQDFFMKIYNRWGELIFETRDVNYGWDGTYTGTDEIVMDGIYVWSIEFKTTSSDERKQLTGSLTLVR